MTVYDAITSGPGYHVGHRLSALELQTLRRLITEQYVERLRAVDPAVADEAAALGIDQYHTIQHRVDHAGIWPKQTRILSTEHVPIVKRMGFYQALVAEFGDVALSDDELNWRLVRPDAPDDIGPIHADGWFWDLGHGTLPPGYDRFKIWIPIHSEVGANGLSVLPDSHRRDWRHHMEIRHGIPKPVIDEDVTALPMKLLPLAAGEMVMFHDRLLHGGVVNRGTRCRVSLEMTIFFPANHAVRRRSA